MQALCNYFWNYSNFITYGECFGFSRSLSAFASRFQHSRFALILVINCYCFPTIPWLVTQRVSV